LAGATVRLVQHGSPRPGGVTSADGAVSVETQAPGGEYTVVVTRPASKQHPYGYLLVKRLRVDEDTAVALAPRTGGQGGDPAAVVELALDRVSEEHQAWTYLRHELTAPVGFAFGPGKVVATVGAYELRHVHEVAGFERDWWALSDVRKANFPAATGYRQRFGGPAGVNLTATAKGTSLTATWSVTDAHRVPFTVMAHTPLRSEVPAPVPPPAVAALADLPSVVLARAPEPEEAVLRLFDPTGTQLHAGGLRWDRREVTRELSAPVAAGRYRLELSVTSDGYSPNGLTGTTECTVG
jgi:hypothetical protein